MAANPKKVKQIPVRLDEDSEAFDLLEQLTEKYSTTYAGFFVSMIFEKAKADGLKARPAKR